MFLQDKRMVAGYEFERRVVNFLREAGWVAGRTVASKGPYDVHALKLGQKPLLIQCKCNGGLSRDKKAALYLLAEHVGAIPMLAYKHGRQHKLRLREITREEVSDLLLLLPLTTQSIEEPPPTVETAHVVSSC